jgi:EmrB/QacA subfamily drug resistance transporter
MTAASPLLRYGTSSARWVLLATILGSGLASLDATVVNIALPSIGRELHVGLTGLQWTSNAYSLSLAAFILLGGALGDRFGRRRALVVGALWFSLSSLFCGVAQSVPALIAARAFQGLGGALLTPASLAILETTFDPRDSGRAIGAWSGLGELASAVAPFLGGYLVDTFSWRFVFLLNLPLAALVIWVSLRHVPETQDPGAATHLDLPGAILAAVGLAGLTYAFIEGPIRGWTSRVLLTSATLGSGSLALFLWLEARSKNPMLPLQIFRSRQFSSANGVTFVVYAALGGGFFLLPIHLQQVLGYSALRAGTALLPVTAIMLLLSGRMGAWALRRGPRAAMTVGPVLVGIGFLMFSRIEPGSHFATRVLPGILVFGLGLAVMVAPLTAAVLDAAPARFAGIASAINNDVAQIGGLLAVAVIPCAAGLNSGSFTDPIAFTEGFRHAMQLCAALTMLGGVLALFTIQDQKIAAYPQRVCSLETPPLQPRALPSQNIS